MVAPKYEDGTWHPDTIRPVANQVSKSALASAKRPEIFRSGRVTTHDGRENEGPEDFPGSMDSLITLAQTGLSYTFGVGGEILGIEFDEEGNSIYLIIQVLCQASK
jgi:hypothetical protein